MTNTDTAKYAFLAPQNWGGYGCYSVGDNPLERIYYALSWLLATTSAFVYSAVGSALGVVAELSSRHWFSARRSRRVAFPPPVLLLPVVWQISPAFTLYTLHFTLK